MRTCGNHYHDERGEVQDCTEKAPCRGCLEACIAELERTVKDHEEVHADKRQLVREMDVIMNGEEGAARQASLGDIVAQLAKEWQLLQRATTAVALLDKANHQICDLRARMELLDMREWMPIMGTWYRVSKHILSEEQAQANHGQSLKRLADRGGLAWCEAAALAEARPWVPMTESAARMVLARVLRENPWKGTP